MMTRMARRRLLVTALGLVAAEACRTGARPRPGAPTAAPGDFIRSYVGQSLILRHRGDERSTSLDRKAAERPSGKCDAAVEVKQAAFEKGVVQLRLDYLGEPRIEGKRGECRRRPREIDLRITGFAPDEPAEAVRSVVGRILQTPEAVLAAHGMRFELAAGAPPTLAADRSPVGKEAEMRLAREVTRWPRKLFWVECAYADPTRKVRHEGQLEFNAIVGADGRLHAAQLTTPLADAQEKQVRRALPLWRFDPARRGSEPVAARVTEQTVFRIF